MDLDFTPCSSCTSPMACRNVGMCGHQYEPTAPSKPAVVSTKMTISEVIDEIHGHAERAKNWPVHAEFHLERIEKILKDYRK